MSVEETSQGPTMPLPPRPEAKQRPEIPPKPPVTQTDSPSPSPLGERGSNVRLSGGKVKRIVNKFTKQASAGENQVQPTNGTSDFTQSGKRFKRPPTIKPKPNRVSLQLQVKEEQAPPLPKKRSKRLQKQKELTGGEEADSINVEGGRSAPDGKEVEVQLIGGGEADVEHGAESPLSPSCDPNCSCMCHLQRPGMKLIWVPVDMEDGGQEEEDGDEQEEDGGGEEDGEDGEGEEDEVDVGEQKGEDEEDWELYEAIDVGGGDEGGAEEEEEAVSVVDENEVFIENKAKFNQTLDVLIAEGHRRRSDPGPHSVLNSLAVMRSQSPPVPPKRSNSPQIQVTPSQDDEDNIYEATLPVLNLPLKKTKPVCKELDIPLIKVRKPARRSKLNYSTSDPTSEFQMIGEPVSSPQDEPPAIPPRVPLTQDASSSRLSSVARAGVPLPQPTLEEWRNLRPASPNPPVVGGLSPQRAITPPLNNSVTPHRPPPPPPKTDPRRLSSASVQSLTQKKDGEENTGNEGDKEDVVEELNNSHRRETLSSWESRLQDEPLYQTYRASVITKEIRRQTVCRNISKTSVDYAMDLTSRKSGAGASVGASAGAMTGNGATRGSPVAATNQNTLWQDLQNIRDSGVLEQLTPEQCKYQESMFEVLTSEASYLRSLRVLTEHFLDNRDLEQTMIIRDKKTLFSNILRIREVSERFLKDLEERIFTNLVFPDICDIIHYHGQHNFPAYIDYVRNQIYQEKTYSTLMKNNVQFATVIARLQESPQCQRLPFMSFLLLPFQRITRIKMLIENILKRTKEGTKEEETASKALASVSKIIDECNTQVGKMRQMEELIYISQTLEFEKLKAIPIISQTRFLEKKGELQEMSRGGTLLFNKAKFTPVYLFLFNDLLIITVKKGAERFVVIDHAHRSLVQAEAVDETGSSSGSYEHCFNLTLLENHQGRLIERLFKAPSQSDMHRWMAAFPNPTNPDRDDDEVIYEDWDCPQVQCVEQYISQQADELSLEPTEIINIIRKTNEGWYEGSRLSDGQKGWFPVGNVIEITNEHVRRRNLRERYRVMQAASKVAFSKNRTTT